MLGLNGLYQQDPVS